MPAKAVDWIPANVVIPEETETPGKFDLDLFPHVRGVLEEIDNPDTRRIILKWAARNGKTNVALSALIFFACTIPRPMVFCEATEETANDKIAQALYPMLEACPLTRSRLLPTHRRNQKSVDLGDCRIRRAYSGSRATVRGFPACFIVGSEVSAYNTNKSGDASTVRMLEARAKLYPFDSKEIYESTPAKKGSCQITALIEGESVDRRYRLVPCPHCGTFQRLQFEIKGENSPGIHWAKKRHGHSDPMLAEETAFYRCLNGCKIENADRPRMMRGGVWLSEGQTIDKSGRIHGEPRVRSSTVGFDELSSLYSLVISGWGQIAKEFLDANSASDRQEALQNFTNSTLGKTWDPNPQTVDPDELATRLCHDVPRGVCPHWSVFLTAGIDVQDDGQRFVWVVCAWGPGGIGAEIDHGECNSFDELKTQVLNRPFRHSDHGPPLSVQFTLIDSGDATERVYDLCRSVQRVLPCKGFPQLGAMEYKIVTLTAEKRRNANARGDVVLCEINTDYTQKWIRRHIEGFRKDDEQPFYLSMDTGTDVAFLDDLLNEQRIVTRDKRGYEKPTWQKVFPSNPNDFRDALRYARVAADYRTSHGKFWNRLPTRAAQTAEPGPQPPKPKTFQTPDGRPYLISERH